MFVALSRRRAPKSGFSTRSLNDGGHPMKIDTAVSIAIS